MAVIPITVIVGLCLVFSFLVFFLGQHARERLSSVERDSLLPLADESFRVVRPKGSRAHGHEHDHDHDHEHGAGCGCRDGSRPPCAGCLKRHSHRH